MSKRTSTVLYNDITPLRPAPLCASVITPQEEGGNNTTSAKRQKSNSASEEPYEEELKDLREKIADVMQDMGVGGDEDRKEASNKKDNVEEIKAELKKEIVSIDEEMRETIVPCSKCQGCASAFFLPGRHKKFMMYLAEYTNKGDDDTIHLQDLGSGFIKKLTLFTQNHIDFYVDSLLGCGCLVGKYTDGKLTSIKVNACCLESLSEVKLG